MEELHLKHTLEKLQGPPPEQIIVHNYWAATALDRFHQHSKAEMEFSIEGSVRTVNLSWDSDFSKAAMKEDVDIANHGGVGVAWFVMSVLLEYGYVEQSEIGDGVDYRFLKAEPSEDNFNFLEDHHYIEVSGILEESSSNTLKRRIREKHEQISKGSKKDKSSSIVITLFSQPKTVKEFHT